MNTNNKTQWIQYAVAGGAFFLLATGSAHAYPATEGLSLEFGMAAPTTGKISYAGGAVPLTGSAIDIDTVTGGATSLHASETAVCLGCRLDFSTGLNTGYSRDALTGMEFWTFGNDGSITIKGGVDFLDNSVFADIPAGSTLLSGTLNAASVSRYPGRTDFRVAGGSLVTLAHPAGLLAYFGLPAQSAYEGGLNLSFSAGNPAGGGFTSTRLFSGDVVSATDGQTVSGGNPGGPAVPVPPAVLLLASGIAGVVARRGRQAA